MLSFLLSLKMKKFSILLLTCLLASSCALFRSRPARYPAGVMFPLVKSGEALYQGRILEGMEREGEKLFLSTSEGLVYCIDAAERKTVWSYESPAGLSSRPYLGAENIYVCDEENTLHCLSKDGNLLWKKGTGETITSGVAEFKDRVGFGTEKGFLVALKASDGEEAWRFQAGEAIRTTPVFAAERIFFGSDDRHLYILSEAGKLQAKIPLEAGIQAAPLVVGKYLYFGADDHFFYSFNWMKKKKRWRVRTGGKVLTSPLTDGRRVLFISWNNVLYCLHRQKGHILWWKAIPSRSLYRLEVSGERIVATSLSSLVLCFDIETGEKVGEFDAGQEVKSNPLWLEPHLLINLYDNQKNRGRLVFLKKQIQVFLSPSKASPQKAGGEITFTASAAGFFEPRYEFYLRKGDKAEVVQEKSEKTAWTWFPEKEGEYVVGVLVVDGKERASAEVPFRIVRD